MAHSVECPFYSFVRAQDEVILPGIWRAIRAARSANFTNEVAQFRELLSTTRRNLRNQGVIPQDNSLAKLANGAASMGPGYFEKRLEYHVLLVHIAWVTFKLRESSRTRNRVSERPCLN